MLPTVQVEGRRVLSRRKSNNYVTHSSTEAILSGAFPVECHSHTMFNYIKNTCLEPWQVQVIQSASNIEKSSLKKSLTSPFSFTLHYTQRCNFTWHSAVSTCCMEMDRYSLTLFRCWALSWAVFIWAAWRGSFVHLFLHGSFLLCLTRLSLFFVFRTSNSPLQGKRKKQTRKGSQRRNTAPPFCIPPQNTRGKMTGKKSSIWQQQINHTKGGWEEGKKISVGNSVNESILW